MTLQAASLSGGRLPGTYTQTRHLNAELPSQHITNMAPPILSFVPSLLMIKGHRFIFLKRAQSQINVNQSHAVLKKTETINSCSKCLLKGINQVTRVYSSNQSFRTRGAAPCWRSQRMQGQHKEGTHEQMAQRFDLFCQGGFILLTR